MENIKVEFHHEDPGKCQTTFKKISENKYYNRIESNNFGRWYTVYPSQGYWENSSEVNNDVIFEVMDKNGNLLFTESNGNLGAFKSIGKKACEIAANFKEKLNLCPHKDWYDWLYGEMASCGYTGERDNWLYYDPEVNHSKTIGEYMHFGFKFRIIIDDVVHPICGKTWSIAYIQNMENTNCEKICGYLLDIEPTPPIAVKTLAHLKRLLTKGAEFYVAEHCCPEITGERRKVNHVDTTGIYTIVPGYPDNKTLKANSGKGSFLGWSRCAFWSFRDDGICALYSSDKNKIPENLIIAICIIKGGTEHGK